MNNNKRKNRAVITLIASLSLVLTATTPAFANEESPIIESDKKIVHQIEELSEINKNKPYEIVEIEFPIRIIEDNKIPAGVEIIEQKGEKGQKGLFKAKEYIIDIDGEKRTSETTWEETIEDPIEQIVRKGTKEAISGIHPKIVEKEQKLAEERAAQARAAQEAYAGTETRTDSNPPQWTGGGDKESWLREAGIAESDWGYVDFIVQRESSWNPNAVNASSGASGLVQALPCSKVPGNCFNPVDNLRWADGYAKNRYQSWSGAYNFWQNSGWW